MPHLIKERFVYDAVVALNFSGSKELLRSALHYQQYLVAERKPTPALTIGLYVHALVLEPAKAVTNFAVLPEAEDTPKRPSKKQREAKKQSPATLAAIVFWDEFDEQNKGKTILTAEDMDTASSVAQSMCAIRHGLGVTFTETEVMFMSDDGDVPVKVAIDAIGDDGYLYDLKTTVDASPAGFLKAVRSFKYNLQAYVYLTSFERGFKQRPRGFRFICVEKEPPHAGAVYEIGPDLMAYACLDWEKARKLYKECSDTNTWPGYSTDVQVVDAKAVTSPSQPINFA